jgi:hypothetical protein
MSQYCKVVICYFSFSYEHLATIYVNSFNDYTLLDVLNYNEWKRYVSV